MAKQHSLSLRLSFTLTILFACLISRAFEHQGMVQLTKLIKDEALGSIDI
jgi:hypothetical protein